jgi:malate/lactate dehydrogenase
LVLYDVVPLIKGVAVDLSHVSTHVKLEYYLGDMKNADNAEVDKALKVGLLGVENKRKKKEKHKHKNSSAKLFDSFFPPN